MKDRNCLTALLRRLTDTPGEIETDHPPAEAEADVAASSCFSISSADKKSAGGAELSCAFTIPENSKITLVKRSFSIHFDDLTVLVFMFPPR